MLKEMRIKQGLTQRELAKKANISFRTLQHYEQGSKNISSSRLEKLIDLSIVLKCRISELLDDEKLKEKCKQAMF